LAQNTNPARSNPLLPILSGLIMLAWIIYAVLQYTSYQSQSKMQVASLSDILSEKPRNGTYQVKGGRMYWVYAQAVGFTNDREKDAGYDYTSYVPYIDPASKKVVMLVKMEHYSPKDFTQLIDDDKPQDQTGQFIDPSTVDPELYKVFTAHNYPIEQDTPIFEQFGAPANPVNKIVITGILALLLSGGCWGLLYMLSRPKKRRKSFSERYPDRRTY